MCYYCREGYDILDKEKEKLVFMGRELPVKMSDFSGKEYEKLKCVLYRKEDNRVVLSMSDYKGCQYIEINYCPMCGRKV